MPTKKVVPRATNEGGLGTAAKVWGPSWLQNLTITNLLPSPSDSILVETAGYVEKRDLSSIIAALPPKIESFIMACSDEPSPLIVGANVVKYRMPYSFNVLDVRASLSTAGTGLNKVRIDIHQNGVSMLGPILQFDATELSTVTSSTPVVITSTTLLDNDEISVHINQVDSGGTSAGLKVYIIGYQ
jgi:hypothetical protein